jgi:hypothetical protein
VYIILKVSRTPAKRKENADMFSRNPFSSERTPPRKNTSWIIIELRHNIMKNIRM